MKNSVKIVCGLLIMLWVYAAVSKWAAFAHFRDQMHKQRLPAILQTALIYLLPPAELVIAALLAFDRTVRMGLYASLALLFAFTVYVALATFHVFSAVPCSCGGVLETLGWRAHFYFNLFFLALTLGAILQTYQMKGGAVTKSL